jgi:hypothetical protein
MALMKTKSVSFNIETEIEKELLAWATSQHIGFSTYVKALIEADKKRKSRPVMEGQLREWKIT